ncbi:DUF6572 domain-containing protein [Streptococcus suis]|uniref:DUF6572 domain-containing protein n=1 Tax=Streptococcus suis TaxID=1307 RepID=UPI00215C7559|nr:DUF6572 domain-containing protein [Streptococcus suis]
MEITGTNSKIKFVLDDGMIVTADGELLTGRKFYVYTSTMVCESNNQKLTNVEKRKIIVEAQQRTSESAMTLVFDEITPEKNNFYDLDTTTIDSLGVVDGHLELLLADGNEWLPDTEQDHLLKLQEKLNNYIHFIESKQYVDSYGDDFTEKVINLTFQYAPSDNGLAFLVQVQKALQSTDIRLKVIVPE